LFSFVDDILMVCFAAFSGLLVLVLAFGVLFHTKRYITYWNKK